MDYIKINSFLQVMLGEVKAYIFQVKVQDILPIYYVAVRGKDDEEGAVQRVLNTRRIGSIRDYIINGNMFYTSFILNWSNADFPVLINKDTIALPRVPASAQVIDGQHRLEAFKRATKDKPAIGNQDIIIILTLGLSTSDAARIFLNINYEQKPVPKSLVYDLFGEVYDPLYFIVRATDLATKLHEDTASPLYQCIKLPGVVRTSARIDLSTIVTVLKQHTSENGTFAKYNLTDFESQYLVLLNYLNAIRNNYDSDGLWLSSQNPFLSSAGCHAAISFLFQELISRCAEKKSFRQETFAEFLPLKEIGLLKTADIKNIQGKGQREFILSYLSNALLKEVPKQDEYQF